MSLALGLAVLAGMLAGCTQATVRFVSYKDPYFPETYHVAFTDCVYWIDADGDIHAAACSTQETDHGTLTQYLHVHVFWTPKPGKTHADATTTDATLSYVVAADNGVTLYVGTGFAFPKKLAGGKMELTIESGRLRRELHSGEGPDLFGDTRVTGMLITRHDPGAAVNLVREAELLAAR